jgi:sRNA-binding regulator protein Hfq
MKSVLLFLLLSIPMVTLAQKSGIPLDSSRTTYTIFLKDGGEYIGRIISRDAIKVIVRRKGGGLSYVAPSDITRIEPYQGKIRTGGREQQQITLTDGTVYRGQIEKQDSTMVLLRRRGGKSILSPKEIAKIEPIVDVVDDESPVSVATVSTSSTGSQSNQFPWLLYNQTAIPLKSGQLTYRNIWILYNELSYGFFGFITLRASITPSFSGSTFYNSTLYTRPSVGGKLSIPIGPNVHIGGDLSFRWTERILYGYFYQDRRNQRERNLTGFITFGTTKSNLTFGYSDLKGDNSFNRRQSIDVGFVAPIGRRLSLISDNRILIGQNSYDYDRFSQLSGVLRLNRPRHAFDMGLLVAIRDEDKLRFYPLPYVAFNRRLSRK